MRRKLKTLLGLTLSVGLLPSVVSAAQPFGAFGGLSGGSGRRVVARASSDASTASFLSGVERAEHPARVRPGESTLPTISRFFGIRIRMFYEDHPPAHFHAIYGEHGAVLSIGGLELIQGWLPRRAMALTLEWAMLHRPELRENWARASRLEPLAAIAGLDEEG